MGLLSHRVDRSEIVAGDHIYTWRAVFSYSHHGIYVGGSKVVHFTREQNLDSSGDSLLGPSDPTSGSFLGLSSSSSRASSTCSNFLDCGFRQPESGVVLSCLDCFLDKGSLYRFEYGVTPSAFLTKLRGGTCTTAESDPQEPVIHRAMYLLKNGFGNYNVFKNNCEDFAIYCKTGLLVLDKTALGRSGQAACAIGAPLSAIVSSSLKLFMSSPVGVATATAGMYCMSRYATDIGVRTDVVKVPVEHITLFQVSEGHNEEFAEVNDDCERQDELIENDNPPAKRQRC
ncbi:Lecithin retinol acyltransferase [Actinidia chinensis var. chinensis]|uniref:Lecithin retinol acyltransferase n=1 Tax=Actinidia chinensis var. chinensis TaxID=1590841 RepID=A0A2R6PIE9_ACTCC|nr:Lecithin retinol acyltransferase [Actinidia chinensis var. chinensis]